MKRHTGVKLVFLEPVRQLQHHNFSSSFLQAEWSETTGAVSFTATLQRGADSCEAVKNHMACATAPAPAGLGNTAEPSAHHEEGAGGAFTEGCEHMHAEAKDRSSRTCPEHCQDTVGLRYRGDIIQRGKKVSCFPGGKAEGLQLYPQTASGSEPQPLLGC